MRKIRGSVSIVVVQEAIVMGRVAAMLGISASTARRRIRAAQALLGRDGLQLLQSLFDRGPVATAGLQAAVLAAISPAPPAETRAVSNTVL